MQLETTCNRRLFDTTCPVLFVEVGNVPVLLEAMEPPEVTERRPSSAAAAGGEERLVKVDDLELTETFHLLLLLH